MQHADHCTHELAERNDDVNSAANDGDQIEYIPRLTKVVLRQITTEHTVSSMATYSSTDLAPAGEM